MKRIFIIVPVTKDGVISGKIRAFRSATEAGKEIDESNDISWREQNNIYYIMEEVEVE